jgi:hypothetical protein
MSPEMRRVFAPVLVGCVREACPPRPDELVAVTERIRREAFPTATVSDGWRRAWCVACAAILAAAYLAKALAIAEAEEQRTSTLPRPH